MAVGGAARLLFVGIAGAMTPPRAMHCIPPELSICTIIFLLLLEKLAGQEMGLEREISRVRFGMLYPHVAQY